MTTHQIVQAWKDPAYRSSLTEAQREELPAHPSGVNIKELDETDLQYILGAAAPPSILKVSCGHWCTLTTECPFLSFCCS